MLQFPQDIRGTIHAPWWSHYCGLPVVLLPLLFGVVLGCNRNLDTVQQAVSTGARDFSQPDQNLLLDAISKGTPLVQLLLIADGAALKKAKAYVESHGGFVQALDQRLGYLVVKIPPDQAMTLPRSVQLVEILLDQALSAQPRTKATGMHGTTKVNDDPLGQAGFRDFWKRSGTTGEGITVAVIDSGVELAHPAFAREQGKTLAMCRDFSGEGRVLLTPAKGRTAGATTLDAGCPEAEQVLLGHFDERRLEGTALADFNRNGRKDEHLLIRACRRSVGWRVSIDRDGDGSFRGEPELEDFSATGQTLALDPQGKVQVGVSLLGADGHLREIATGRGETTPYLELCFDGNGHGTHVAGIIAGRPVENTPLGGGAPGVSLHSLKVEYSDGSIMLGSIFQALSHVLDHKVEVINLSLNTTKKQIIDALDRVLEKLSTKYGIVVSTSAGNAGSLFGSISSPGTASAALTTGGFLAASTLVERGMVEGSGRDIVWQLSSVGPGPKGGAKPDLIAPCNLFSAVPLWGGDSWDPTPYPGYETRIGTSMAAPMTTAAAALLLAASRMQGGTLNPLETKRFLTASAERLSGYPFLAQGHGRLNLARTFDLFRRTKGQALPDIRFREAPGKVVDGLTLVAPGTTVVLGIQADRELVVELRTTQKWLGIEQRVTLGRTWREVRLEVSLPPASEQTFASANVEVLDGESGQVLRCLPVTVVRPQLLTSSQNSPLRARETLLAGRTARHFFELEGQDRQAVAVQLELAGEGTSALVTLGCERRRFLDNAPVSSTRPMARTISLERVKRCELSITAGLTTAETGYSFSISRRTVTARLLEFAAVGHGKARGRVAIETSQPEPELVSEVRVLGLADLRPLSLAPQRHQRLELDPPEGATGVRLSLVSPSNPSADIDLSVSDQKGALLASSSTDRMRDVLEFELQRWEERREQSVLLTLGRVEYPIVRDTLDFGLLAEYAVALPVSAAVLPPSGERASTTWTDEFELTLDTSAYELSSKVLLHGIYQLRDSNGILLARVPFAVPLKDVLAD